MAEIEYGSLLGSAQSVTLSEGETLTVMANNFNNYGVSSDDINLSFPPNYDMYVGLDFFAIYSGSQNTDVNASTPYFGTIVGPCRIQLTQTGKYCSYKITRHEVTASPMNIVSLPSDNNGDVELLIETSTDLLTWTPVYSGSAGTSNNAAFFRTRLITQ